MFRRILSSKETLGPVQIQLYSCNRFFSNKRCANLNLPAFQIKGFFYNKWNPLLWLKCLHYENGCGIKTSALAHVKQFVESENSFAHKVLERMPVYRQTTVIKNVGNKQIDKEEFHRIINTDWSNESSERVYQAFECLSNYCPLHSYSIIDTVFDNLTQALSVKFKEMTDSNLIGVLASLSKWPSTETINSRNFATLWSALDKECVLRIKQWDLNKVLYVADHWYTLSLSKVCNYMWHSNWKLGRKPSRLTPAQLVQTMFYINVYRRIHPGISMYEFEYSFEQCINKLTVDEIGILSMGFFKSQTKIHSTNLISQIMKRTLNEVDTINELTLSAILKVVRYCIPISLADMLYQLLDKLVPQIDRLSLLCCIHIAIAGTNTLVMHEEILKKISQRYSLEIKNIRVKDIERLTFALTLFNYNPQTNPCIFKEIVSELHNTERAEEFAKYPKCVSRGLYYLTIRNIFLKELISKTLDPTFIIDVYGKNKYKVDREILCLDASVEIECPEYDGNRIDTKLRSRLAKNFTKWVPTATKKSMSATDRMFLEVMQSCKHVLGGEQYYHAGTILPHFEWPDIVFYVLPDGKAIEIPETFEQAPLAAVKYPPTLPVEGRWCSFVIGGWNSYIRNTRSILGSTASKIRHLQIVGYSPIYIPWYEWIEVAACDKESYLRSKIATVNTS